MFLSLDGTAIVQLINFAIFFAICNAVFLRPVGAAIKRRRAYIDGVRNEYDEYTAEVKALRLEVDARRAAARREAEDDVVASRSAAEKEAGRIAAEFAESAATITGRARDTVEAELAAGETRGDRLAADLAGDLLKRALETAR